MKLARSPTHQVLAICGRSSPMVMWSSRHQAVFIGSIGSLMSQFRATPNLLADPVKMTRLKSWPKQGVKAVSSSQHLLTEQLIHQVNLGFCSKVLQHSFPCFQWKSATQFTQSSKLLIGCLIENKSFRISHKRNKTPQGKSPVMTSTQRLNGQIFSQTGNRSSQVTVSLIGDDPAKLLASARLLVAMMETTFMFSQPAHPLKPKSPTQNSQPSLICTTTEISLQLQKI